MLSGSGNSALLSEVGDRWHRCSHVPTLYLWTYFCSMGYDFASPGNRLILVFLIRRNLGYLLTHLEASWMDVFCASRSTRHNPYIYSIKGLTSGQNPC